MYHSVIIATTRRPSVLLGTIETIEAQTVRPDEVIVSAVEPADVPDIGPRPFAVRVIFGTRGLPCQRNAGIDALDPRSTLVTFLDDDVELSSDCFHAAREISLRHSELLGFDAEMVADGRRNGGLTRQEALTMLRVSATSSPSGDFELARGGLLGGNLNVRRDVLKQVRFDEELVLYGYLEDADFSLRVRKLGNVAHAKRCRYVHLAVSCGRVSGLRFGISQIVNPFYLYKKGLLQSLRMISYRFWLRALMANAAGVLSPRQQRLFDRRGRLIGNVIGLMAVARNDATPSIILKY